MPWAFLDDKPIFGQIKDILIKDILSGKYQPGDKLEPVRDLAVIAGVNPNTMQRALTEIENTGIIYTKRGDGRYVSEDKEKMKELRSIYAERSLAEFIGAMTALGLTGEEILAAVAGELSRENT